MNITPAVERLPDGTIRSKVYARIGLLGNPSDGYGGKVISLSLANFWAEVLLIPSPTLHFLLNPMGDPTRFSTLASFQQHIEGHGYNGGVRLPMAMTKVLLTYCHRNGITLDPTRLFTLSYQTNIPRQRGLSGSSAIACAALNCILEYYGIADAVPVQHRPGLILDAENELGITAGLQDRIIQVYGGLVYMDFSNQGNTDNDGTADSTAIPGTTSSTFPKCRSLNPEILPPNLYMIYSESPSGKESGTVHSNFKQRWQQNDLDGAGLRILMNNVASLAEHGVAILEQYSEFMDIRLALVCLMQKNLQLRRMMFGDAALGEESLKMVEIANSVGCFGAKFCGSGGAVVALANPETEAQNLIAACTEAGFICVPVKIGPIHHYAQ